MNKCCEKCRQGYFMSEMGSCMCLCHQPQEDRSECCNAEVTEFMIGFTCHTCGYLSEVSTPTSMDWEEIAQKILDHFFSLGVRVTKNDFDFIRTQIQQAYERGKNEKD